MRWTRRHDFLLANAQVLSIAAFFVACCALFAALSPIFLMPGNVLNLLRQSAPMLIVATAMTFVITTGGIDLSVGAIVALTNALAAVALAAGWPWPLAALAVLVAGGSIGGIQGWFTASQKIPAFIVTLAGLSSLRGLALLMTQGYSIPIAPRGIFLDLGRGWILGVPVPTWFALVVAVSGVVALGRMRYGRHVTAVGANPEAARRFGIPAERIIASVYVLSGLSAALAGLIIAARLGSGSSNAAVGFELQAIAAVVLGGTSLFGGSGTVLGTILGALTVAVIENGLILIHVSPFLTQIVTGAIILLAVWLNTRVFARLAARRRTG